MFGIVIRYQLQGDESVWQQAVDAFVNAVDNDPQAAGKFHYTVTSAGDGATRIHIGQWDSEETLKHVQSQDYFSTFAGAVKAFAGDTLDAQRVTIVAETG